MRGKEDRQERKEKKWYGLECCGNILLLLLLLRMVGWWDVFAMRLRYVLAVWSLSCAWAKGGGV